MQDNFDDISEAISYAQFQLKNFGEVVSTDTWQALDISEPMLEILDLSFISEFPKQEADLVAAVKPNMPWARKHFVERVSGPVNPGETYKIWPFFKGKDQDKHSRVHDGQFSHTYMERYWPSKNSAGAERVGIRYSYGDLTDVVKLLIRDPFTRQAYLPVWFPEDTGATQKQRVPCTLGYWFILRNNKLSVRYHIRSCDFFRHFRDDIYLTIRLLKYVLYKCREFSQTDFWQDVEIGNFGMNIGSLHIWKKERHLLDGE